MDDWKITFVETGTDSSIGQRLKAVEPYLQGEETFLANYADGLTDLHLPMLLDYYQDTQPTGLFLSVRPRYNSFHAISSEHDGLVRDIEQISDSDIWMNGGFFAFSRNIFDYIGEGEELIDEPFRRLISKGELRTFKYEGFWGCMDTFKEKEFLEELYLHGPAPWEVWKGPANPPSAQHPSSLTLEPSSVLRSTSLQSAE